MMKKRCIIIDDEPLAVNVISNYLDQMNDFILADTFNNALDGLNYLSNNVIDLIFLDINMPIMDGLTFIKSLDHKPMIIITSAHEEFAVKSYELDVLDYLVKPISLPRFIQSLNKVNKNSNKIKSPQLSNERPFIFIKIDKKKMQKVFLDELLVIECLKDYLKIITTTKNHIIHETLSNFTEQLPLDKFIRIHRSFTVSIDKIDTIEGNSVEIGGIRYVIGRTYVKEVKDRILNWLV